MVAAGLASAQNAGPAGEEFQVNEATTGYQLAPAVAMAADGGFVVVWADEAGGGVVGRRFDASGTALSGDFQVETLSGGGEPDVAVLRGGGFVVVWRSDASPADDASGSSIAGRRFAGDGAPLGGQFQVNSYTTGEQDQPAVAAAAGGGFVVVWRSDGASAGGDADGTSVAGRRFAGDGAPLGSQFQVNGYATGAQESPDAVFASDGGFAVVWQSQGSPGNDADGASIALRAFDPDGTPRGNQAQVNSHTPGDQERPVLARQGDDLAVIWQGDTVDDPDASGVAGRRADAMGAPLGGELQVNAATTGAQRQPAVTEQPGGGFVVLWTSFGAPGDADDAVVGRGFAADGRPLTGGFQVNTYTTEAQYGPAVSAAGPDFVVVWTSLGTAAGDGDYAVAGQRYQGPFFADGFESGDTGAWD